LRTLLLLAALSGSLVAQPARVDTSTPTGEAFVRLYNFDFRGAEAILDRQIAGDPGLPLPYAVKAASLLFRELDRLRILEADFFQDDERVIDRKKLAPDPVLRAELFRLIETARTRAASRLAARAEDRDALFTLSMAAGLETDYAALVERRRLASLPLAKRSQAHTNRLLALTPPYYDAYLTSGAVEYVVGSLYFFIRWFVRIDGIEGNKQKGVEHLETVAKRGRYYGPFARILLSVVHMREKRPGEAAKLLAGLAAEFPENPLFPRELGRARRMAERAGSAASGAAGQ
jgi:hypothetical protein